MVAPGFGFSIGDFIAGSQILIQVIQAFKDAGGASSKYASEVSFLNSLKATLDHLEMFVSSVEHSQGNDLPENISKLLQGIRDPWQEFKTFLDKYERSLGTSSSRSKLAKAPRTIQYTIKDISGKVAKLRDRTEQPLQAINSLLSLHVIQSLEKLPGQLLQPAQCAQLVNAITLADIPTELDKQIRQLKLAADEHNLKQDQQLQTITTLRTQLEERITSLRSVLDAVQGPVTASIDRHDKQIEVSRTLYSRVDQLSDVLENRADQLESAMKEQKQLMLAMKSFLEDKSSRSEHALESGSDRVKESKNQSSWPSSTLSTAYFAALLLSSVLSSVAATSIVTRNRKLTGVGPPTFVQVDYSLPGLGALNKIQIQPSLMKSLQKHEVGVSTVNPVVSVSDKQASSTRLMAASVQAKPEDPTLWRTSEWIKDYFKTQAALRQPKEQRFRVDRIGYIAASSNSPGWVGSVLSPDHDDNDGPGPGNFQDSLGPVIPSPSDGDSSWHPSGGGGGTTSSNSGGYGDGQRVGYSSPSPGRGGGGGSYSSDDSDSS